MTSGTKVIGHLSVGASVLIAAIVFIPPIGMFFLSSYFDFFDLNARHMAIGFWLVGIVTYAFIMDYAPIKQKFGRLFNAFFGHKMIPISYVVMLIAVVASTFGIVGIGRLIGMWETFPIISMTFALIVSGFGSLLAFNDFLEKDNFYADRFKESVAPSAMLNEVANIAILPLLVEIIFVPLITILVIISAIAQGQSVFAGKVDLGDNPDILGKIARHIQLIILGLLTLVVIWVQFDSLDDLKIIAQPTILSLVVSWVALCYVRAMTIIWAISIMRRPIWQDVKFGMRQRKIDAIEDFHSMQSKNYTEIKKELNKARDSMNGTLKATVSSSYLATKIYQTRYWEHLGDDEINDLYKNITKSDRGESLLSSARALAETLMDTQNSSRNMSNDFEQIMDEIESLSSTN